MKNWKKLSALILGATVFLTACGAGANKTEGNKTEGTKVEENKVSDLAYKEIKGKNVNYYVANPDPIMGVSAVLIEKNGKGLLVDTQFSTADADKIVKLAKDKKIDIENIFISYSDPDYYFGTDTVKKAFPNAKVLASKSNIDRISKTNVAKVNVWKDTLKDKTPTKIIIPEELKTPLKLDTEEFELIGKDSTKQTLYNKNDNLLLGGILVADDSHLFMADTKTIESQEKWIDSLKELQAKNAKIVIPGHFGKNNELTSKNIDFTKEYIEKFIKVEKESKTSKEIIEKMKKEYPSLAEGSLEMSAKVVTGEQKWD